MVGFVSDNVSGIHPQVLEAIANENTGYRMPYGNDPMSQRLDEAFSDLFETPVAVIPCSSGTAANALALSLLAGPINSICVHEKSHAYVDECNAPELFTGGARLTPVAGDNGKLDLDSLRQSISGLGDVHAPQAAAISVTQTTESGSVYSLDELNALADFASNHSFALHMDGARIANAVASLDCTPAEMTWKTGMSVLSFGATKNGCMAAEAVVVFDQSLMQNARFRHKRAGQLLSKQRFLSAQLLAYLENDLWLANARLANTNCARLADAISSIDGVQLPESVNSNMMFVRFTDSQIEHLQQAGLAGYVFDGNLMRLCCSWATRAEEIQAFVDCLEGK